MVLSPRGCETSADDGADGCDGTTDECEPGLLEEAVTCGAEPLVGILVEVVRACEAVTVVLLLTFVVLDLSDAGMGGGGGIPFVEGRGGLAAVTLVPRVRRLP